MYKTVGTIPAIKATINRLTGWKAEVREFAYNVLVSFDPNRLETIDGQTVYLDGSIRPTEDYDNYLKQQDVYLKKRRLGELADGEDPPDPPAEENRWQGRLLETGFPSRPPGSLDPSDPDFENTLYKIQTRAIDDRTVYSYDPPPPNESRDRLPASNVTSLYNQQTIGIYNGEFKSITSEFTEPPPSLIERLQQNPPTFLNLTSDAPDCHIVDGIGEIPADGSSFCTITIQKLSYDGTPLTGDDHLDEIFLRTTGGLIVDANGNRLRSLHLQSGQATFRLVSEPTPRLVTVTVFGREPSLQKAEIQIEFV